MPAGARGYGEDHKPLGHGDLDLGRFLDRLADAGFRGPLVFELRVDEALESLNAVKSVRPQYLYPLDHQLAGGFPKKETS
jgi:sugar phosphate isomerase/epimerase